MSTIITRNSANSGSVPSSLVQGELAINVKDGRLFYGSGSGNVVREFTGSASGGGTINTGSFVTTSSFNNYTGSNTSQFSGTASYATQALSASYALNGGVTQLLAGPNVTLSPTNGLGQVTVSATLSGSTNFNTATGSYGSFYSTQTQTNVASTVRSMSLNTTDITNGVSISGSTNPYNTYIKTENAGVYNIQFSAQVDKSDAGKDEIWIWLRKNGTDLTDTATSIQLTGNADHQVAAWNFFVNAAAGDYFQLMWYSPDVNVRLHAEPAFGVVPGIPSLIVTANKVDQFLSNTGSFSGSFTGNLIGTASYATQALSASFATSALSASYAPDTTFPYTGSAIISGSLTLTGSFNLKDVSSNFSILGNGFGQTSLISPDGALVLTPGIYGVQINGAFPDLQVNGNTTVDGYLASKAAGSYFTGSLLGTASYATQALSASYAPAGNPFPYNGNAQISGSLVVTGSLIVSGSSTFTNIGPARFSGSFIVRGDLIPGSPPFIPNIGPYDAIKVNDIAGQRLLYGTPNQGASASIDFGNRTLYTSNGTDALSWNGQSGTYETYLYNQQYITETNRGNLFAYNSYGGQILGDSYFNIAVTDNDLVYLNTDGQWYQVDQTTNTSTKMLGIAKSVFSQTGSVVIEGDIVITTATGYPAVTNAGYGLPVYIKQGAGTAMDTAIPVSGYVRLLGHCYWNSGGGGDEWIMKFRPSNDWYVI